LAVLNIARWHIAFRVESKSEVLMWKERVEGERVVIYPITPSEENTWTFSRIFYAPGGPKS
jgi:hypothetical protein